MVLSNQGNAKTYCNVTVAIPTYKRQEKLLETLDKIINCNPVPNEIIIHIDAGDNDTATVVKKKNYESSYIVNIKLIKSSTRVGPGGGRNKIINIASNPIIASFDDDSYPIDPDYFLRIVTLFEKLPNAAVIGANIFHIGESIKEDQFSAEWVSDFIGCGCAYRRDAFHQTSGYIPLPLSYGIEEVDLAIRLYELGWEIANSAWLRVFHNTALEHRNNPVITAASLSNQFLLVYLRYPIKFYWLGMLQICNRASWLIRHKRLAGIIDGILLVPKLILENRKQRQPVSDNSLRSYFHRRKISVPVKIS
jgi:GT2 family glycosyltransferase